MINKEIIKKNFSQCAPYYDKYSTVQNLCARRLISQIQDNNLTHILELGCGTGNYTKLLRQKFPQAKILAVDISREMISVAEEKISQDDIEFITADGEAVYFKECFGLISSNVTFQWFENLGKALLRYRDLLDKDGLIFFSLFGPRTFFELNESLQELLGKSALIDSHSFIEKQKIEKILHGVFKKAKVESEVYKETSHSLTQLLKKIRYTGVRGKSLEKRSLWTPKMVKELEMIYRQKFKDITTTYEAFFCQGVK